MTHGWRIALYVVGGILMALPGVFTTGSRFYFMAFMGGGSLLLVTACVKYEFTAPRTALLLLLVSNASFWLSYALWFLRAKLGVAPPREGIDPFAGPLSLWLLLFLAFLVYETVVFVVGLTTNRQRGFAAAGLVALVPQILVTLRTIYTMIKGV
jgi:hypothetical protein